MTRPSESSSVAQSVGLSITFNGPMLFDFSPTATVDVYVPFCPYHEAGFFFARGSFSETDLWKCVISKPGRHNLSERAYSISGAGIISPGTSSFHAFDYPQGLTPKTITPPESRTVKVKGAPGAINYGYVLQLASKRDARKRRALSPNLSKRMFQLSVPIPLYVTPLYHDSVEVRADFSRSRSRAKNGSLAPHCTALRFYYEWDAASAIQLSFARGGTCDITPPVFKGIPGIPDIEVRYAGIDIADENDPHSDARSCFASLAALADTTWWIDYQDGMCSPTNSSYSSGDVLDPPDPCANTSISAPRTRFHTGGDCHAPIIVNGFD